MLATAQTWVVLCVDGYIVQADVELSPGLPPFDIVGLPDGRLLTHNPWVRSLIALVLPYVARCVFATRRPMHPGTFMYEVFLSIALCWKVCWQ